MIGFDAPQRTTSGSIRQSSPPALHQNPAHGTPLLPSAMPASACPNVSQAEPLVPLLPLNGSSQPIR
ncbi:MAG: hypothetical protein AB1453_15415 [Chloroflexota bacterium]